MTTEPYDVVHKVANEYFECFCSDERCFTHLVRSKKDYLITYFYLKYNKTDLVDAKKKLTVLINFC